MINSIDKTKLIVIAPSDAEPVSLETCHLKITLTRIADVNLEKERPIFFKTQNQWSGPFKTDFDTN